MDGNEAKISLLLTESPLMETGEVEVEEEEEEEEEAASEALESLELCMRLNRVDGCKYGSRRDRQTPD